MTLRIDHRTHTSRRMPMRAVGLALLLCGVIGGDLVARAQSGDRAVVTFGDSKLSVSQVQKAARKVPAFQLRALGKTDDEVRKALVGKLVDMELIAMAAREQGFERLPELAEDIRVELKDALLADVHREIERSGDISADDIKAYYTANQEQYRSQLRLKLWRILVASKEDADAILEVIKNDAEYKKDPVAGWEKLARERSLDKGTSMSGGNLGFVHPDGSTANQDLAVNPVLFERALKVGDGEVVPVPIQDGDAWVVLQRRGSHQTPERTLEMETDQIRRVLARKRGHDHVAKLLEKLRAKNVSELHLERVEHVEVTRPMGDLRAQQRPGALPRVEQAAAGTPRPEGPPDRLR